MKCEDMQELLALYADGSLDREEVNGVKEHLAACAFCSGELAALQDTLLLVRDTGAPPMPPELHRHIMQGVRREKKRARGNVFWLRFSRPLATAAAVLLIFFAGGNFYLANQYLSMSRMPQSDDMLLENQPESDVAALDERSKEGDGILPADDGNGSSVALPVGTVNNFLYFNGSLIMLGGGLWYYYRRFSRGER
jgi:predicted anti-sigma-YlaC factor YlaD